MSTVNSTTSSNAFAALNGTAASATQSSTQETEDRFLKLLITQLQNQDPLNPLDNAQVTTQMAQINTVQGIDKLNGTLAKVLDSYDETQTMQAAGMIGKYVLVAGTGLPLAGGVAHAGLRLDEPADSVVISIQDSSGKVVQTQDLGARPAGSFAWSWDGMSDANAQLPDGNYTFTVSALRGENTVPATLLQAGMVNAVVKDKTGYTLDLGSAGQVAFSAVEQIL